MSYQLDSVNPHLNSSDQRAQKRSTKSTTKGDTKKSSGKGQEKKVAKPKTKLESKQLETAIIEPGELFLQREIGKGNFGVVWKGKCRGVDVAIKKLHAESFDPNTMEEIKKEVALMTYISINFSSSSNHNFLVTYTTQILYYLWAHVSHLAI
jgi:hypothetical protein